MNSFEHSLSSYLKTAFGPSTRLTAFKRLGAGVHGAGFLVETESEQGRKSYVLKDLAPEGLGHDYPSDRAAVFLLAHDTYGQLPRHVRTLDVVAARKDGSIHSIGGGLEYYLLMERAEGDNYFADLDKLASQLSLNDRDKKKIRTMAEYLAAIHSVKKESKTLYWRKIRDTIGHGECLMGVFDTYPDGTLSYEDMAGIEKKTVEWRARLKPCIHRLSQIHGDFHPGNIWFENNGDFILLDRSRGPWGDPADDVTALIINYIFFSIKYHGAVQGAYQEGLEYFFITYLALSGDNELTKVVQPFFAFRGAVVANPVFYPELTSGQRGIIFKFINNVLDSERFDVGNVNKYLS